MSDTNLAADPAAEAAAAEAAAAEAAAASGDADLEGRARRMGWRPKDEFRGDSTRWTDAKTFVDRGETELPVLRERYRTLDDRYARLETAHGANTRELGEVKSTVTEMREVLSDFRDRAKRAEEVAYTRARTDLEQRMAVAVEQADNAGYTRAKAELDNLNRQERDALRVAAEPKKLVEPAEKKDPTVQVDPVVTQWVSENLWFNMDQGMAGYATAQFQRMRNERPGVDLRTHLDAVRADVVSRFPDKFENPKRTVAAAVAAPGAAVIAKRKGPPPFEQWPADAKAGYAKAKKWMPDYKQDEYAKMYFAEEQ